MDVSDIGCSLVPPWSKDAMNKAIEQHGREEIVKRLAWLHDESEEVVSELLEQFLTDNFVDHKGTVGGHFFWGEI